MYGRVKGRFQVNGETKREFRLHQLLAEPHSRGVTGIRQVGRGHGEHEAYSRATPFCQSSARAITRS